MECCAHLGSDSEERGTASTKCFGLGLTQEANYQFESFTRKFGNFRGLINLHMVRHSQPWIGTLYETQPREQGPKSDTRCKEAVPYNATQLPAELSGSFYDCQLVSFLDALSEGKRSTAVLIP